MITNQGVEVVKFSTEWCGPCKTYAPVFDKAAAELAGKGWKFASVKPLTKDQLEKINGDRDEKLPPLGEYIDFAQYGVSQVPCTIVLKDGVELGRKQGVMMNVSAIERFVESCL